MKKRTIFIGIFILFLVGVISIIGTYAIDSTITEGNSSTADYLFNITLGDRTNREVVIPSYDSKIVDIKISNPNEFAMSYLLYIEGVNSNISVINIKDTEASGVLASKTVTIIQVFIQNNSNSDITIKIKDIVGFEKETLTLPDNSTSINKGNYYKMVVKSNNKTYGKVKPNIKLSTINGIVKYEIVPNTGYKYKSTTCEGSIANNILTISNITSNVNCEVVFEPIEVTVSLDTDGGEISTTYTEAQEHTYIAPYSGTYKLEVWGAQGGTYNNTYIGGYGGYSIGSIYLTSGRTLYINIGGLGSFSLQATSSVSIVKGGYNGGGEGTSGGDGTSYSAGGGGGGGATHIATVSGLLSSLSSNISSILIVAGGGGGVGIDSYESYVYSYSGGNGGGISGNIVSGENTTCTAGNQTLGSSFGAGGNYATLTHGAGGGGGGYYGGTGGGVNAPGCGGSGYIGNSLLTNKFMYCYNCSTSDAESTKTYSTTNVSSSPISGYAKSGGGAARITLIDNANYVVSYGQNYGTLPIPTKEGYVFAGWYTGENGTGTKITENTVLANANNHTLYAYWTTPSKYTTSGSYTYTVPRDGLYKIEVWGAQGGNSTSYSAARGGYGAYSVGSIYLSKNDILYINVGGQGTNGNNSSSTKTGGYNGGGDKINPDSSYYSSSGGGATHVATVSGELSTLSSYAGNNDSPILIVAGGGGGGAGISGNYGAGGDGGGIVGMQGTNAKGNIGWGAGGTQTTAGCKNTSTTSLCGTFGKGNSTSSGHGGAGGGGYYGGGGTNQDNIGGGGGGSGYIGNSQLTNKYMYCYNCTTSDEVNTKTYTTTNVSSTPTSDYAKSGSGAAIITYLGEDTAPVGTITASKDYNNINVSINVTDDFGIDHYEYYLSTSDTCPTDGYTISSSNSYTYNITSTGTYYVCARVVDTADNVLSLVSQPINYSRIYSVAIRYNTNGGTITSNTASYTWTTDDTGLIYQNGNIYEQVIRHGTPADLANYNNSEFINITPPNDLYVTSGSEWKCLSGCSVANKIFSQTTKYDTSDFCDVTDNNCTVVLGLNLAGDTTAPTCTLSANSSTITASASDTGGSGLVYYGWDSSYSGDNSTSKSITTGTHTYYVKDGAGNTGSCSISIIATTKGSYVDCGGYLEDSGGCYYWKSATPNYTAGGDCWCKKSGSSALTIGFCYISGSSAACSCPSGTSVSSNNCTKSVSSYSCSSGYLSGSSCKVYTSGTTVTTYTCPSEYTKIDNSYCYK